ncbi:anthocyanidin 3-O-glucosyltransferase 2-like [Phalaenopsis equestris]|uniref:anthocyanidin 3-O-glucosyltransferase 2-like n=1 Tax=Phalaenopsis equestris TaxID=78828 RepID=UPI0009E6247A|nr:anthocyanidin 3-O-glucosyltransferase 2-like [Phalaenopsis equestris]
MEKQQKKKINLAFLPASGAGHTPSTIELAKLLLLHPSAAGRLSVSLILTPSTACFASSLSLLPTSTSSSSISIYYLPSIDLPSPQSTDGMADYSARCFQLYTPHIKSALATTSASALIIDFFATAVIDAADELQIPTYAYIPFNASMLSLVLHLPTLHDEIPIEFHQFHDRVHVPGLPPIPPLSMPSPIMNKKSRLYTWSIYHAHRLKQVRGILVNTFRALEKGAISAMELDESIPPIHPIGPILRLSTSSGERHECLLWLDEQPAASVVFLCFGSMGMMTAAQAGEAAAGIERSGYRFLWILRLADGEKDGFPLGFRERTKGKGMVWEGWVPQMDILGHMAVGGFVTHGGWNSSLESLWCGVPMVAWPMYAEQHLNAFLMATEMSLAAEMASERRREGWVTAEEVERKVRWLMEESEEGRAVRERVKQMKAASRESVENGGAGVGGDELHRLITELSNESYERELRED